MSSLELGVSAEFGNACWITNSASRNQKSSRFTGEGNERARIPKHPFPVTSSGVMGGAFGFCGTPVIPRRRQSGRRGGPWGDTAELEDEHDGREPPEDDEPTLGWKVETGGRRSHVTERRTGIFVA